MRIEYSSNDIKKKYKTIANKHTIVYSIVHALEKIIKLVSYDTKENDIKITNVINELHGSLITMETLNNIVNIYIDYHNKKVNVISSLLPYKIIYDDYPRKYFAPSGYEYDSDERTIFHKYLARLNKEYQNTFIFTLIEKNIDNKYNVLLDLEDSCIDISVFLNNLLNYDNNITNIKDLLIVISNLISLEKCKIKVTDAKGNIININNGNLINYVEYREDENKKQKIFLKDNEFYIEKSITEEYCEDTTSFIKKIGVNYGKEKR